MEKTSNIYIAGHNWLVWSAIKRLLTEQGYTNLICKNSQQLDLTNNQQVEKFFKDHQVEYVFLAAAKVWGIAANNNFPADFLYKNLQIQNNVIHHSHLAWVTKLLFLGSSCIYPKLCPQPIKESYLLSWTLEPTNEPYAIAKIAGIKMCQSYNRQYGTNFIACMPTNLYGPWDNFDLENSHVLPAMIRKFHEAKQAWSSSVTLWWDGTPMREFLYVDDMAQACIYMMQYFKPSKQQNLDGEIFLNIWTWKDITIQQLAQQVQEIVWFSWTIDWDSSKPNGSPRKLLDVSLASQLGWNYSTDLNQGIEKSYHWFLKNNS